MESWLRKFARLSDKTEIPEMFALWCGICSLSAVLGRKVWIDMGVYEVFPNLFVVLVAGSGRCRKSTAIGLAEGILFQMDPVPNLISQKITPEALIDSLRRKDDDGRNSCTGFVVVDELATFLNKKSYEAGLASLLIPMYDCKYKFEYRTRARGVEVIEKSCLGILGGSTIEWIREAIPIDAIGGGLTSRIVFIYQGEPKEPVAWTEKDEEKDRLGKELVEELKKLGDLKGEIKLSNEARKVYEEEYCRFYKGSEFFNNKYLAGYASRRHVHMLKLGMLLAVGETHGLVVEKRHLEISLNLLGECERGMEKVLSLISASDTGEYTSMVRELIRRNRKGISRTEVMRRMSYRLTSRELTEVLQTLIVAGQIEARTDGKEVVYMGMG